MDWRWLAGFICVLALLGCDRPERAVPPGPAGDVKAQIYQHLAKQTGQKQFTPGIDFDLPGHAATLRSNAIALEKRVTDLRAQLRALDETPTPLQQQMEKWRTEVAEAERSFGEARALLQEAERRTPTNANEVSARRTEREAKEAIWLAKRAELTAKEAQQNSERTAQKQKRAALEQQLAGADRAWKTARIAAARKQEELSNQEDNYIRSVRQRMSDVRSYEQLYALVGQQLATADRLLAEQDVSRRRMGLNIARDACGHVNSDGVDVWLAARICEAYFWPNLEIADTKPGSRERTLDLLETCRRVFFDTYETNHVLTNYHLLMAHAPDARAADMFRVQLADWLEEKGAIQRAHEILSEIRDQQVLASAEERITRVKERVATTP